MVIFAVAQSILSPFFLKMASRYASAFLGGIGLVSTLAALILASVFTSGLSIRGIGVVGGGDRRGVAGDRTGDAGAAGAGDQAKKPRLSRVGVAFCAANSSSVSTPLSRSLPSRSSWVIRSSVSCAAAGAAAAGAAARGLSLGRPPILLAVLHFAVYGTGDSGAAGGP